MGYYQVKSYEDWVRATAQRLAHQGITMYMVDARGLTGPASNEEDSNTLGPLRGRQRTFGGYQQSAQLSSDPLPAMYEMAEVTGGRVITNWNDATEGMREVAADLRGSYTLGFYAVDEPDAKWRRLNLKVKRKDVKLSYRKGYLSEMASESPLEWSEQDWQTAIYNPLGSTAIRLDAHCEKAPGDNASAIFKLVLNIPADDLYFHEENGQREAEAEVAIVEKTPAGGVHIRKEPAKFALPAVPAGETEDLLLAYTQAWTATPGTSTIRLIVRDKFTGRYGMLDVPVSKVPLTAADGN
jgi:hypothetical protein